MGNATVLVKIDGPVNSVTGTDIDAYISDLTGHGTKFVIVDASGIDFISSEGIGLFLMLNDKLRQMNGNIVLFNFVPEVQSLFNALGFESVLPIADSRQEAEGILDKIKQGVYRPVRKSVREDYAVPEVEVTANEHKWEKSERKKDDTFIVECPDCKALVRIHGAGDYLCPECSTEILVSDTLEIKQSPGKIEKKDSPVIAECPDCRTLIRITDKGDYLCPECTREFTVLDDYSIKF